MSIRNFIKRLFNYTLTIIYGKDSPIIQLIKSNNPNILSLLNSTSNDNLFHNRSTFQNSFKGTTVKLASPHKINDSIIGDYTYIAQNSIIKNTQIGKFCSIGPNLLSGWGIHPTDGISTAPMFYSTLKQNGFTLSTVNKVEELKKISIGNDVFIGMNVSILDGITIGDGAIIGAGAIVSKDIPPYAIAVGSPIKIIRYRFDEDTIQKMLQIEWWNWDINELKNVEELFFNVEEFTKKFYKK